MNVLVCGRVCLEVFMNDLFFNGEDEAQMTFEFLSDRVAELEDLLLNKNNTHKMMEAEITKGVLELNKSLLAVVSNDVN